MHIARQGVRSVVRRLGYDIVRMPRPQAADVSAAGGASAPSEPRVAIDYRHADFDEEADKFFAAVEPYTLTTKERVAALRLSVEYVVDHEVPGDIVECGVWKGGSMMAVARTLLERGDTSRKLYLFDTFEGMPPPGETDIDFRGDTAAEILSRGDRKTSIYWAYSPFEEAKRNLESTGYDKRRIVFVKGKVEDTLPQCAPERISLLRLDTDWYESTYHELVHLYPRLSVGGVLLVDDYGHWAGARKAVDQYIRENHLPVLLNRIDYSGRVCVKLRP